MHAVWLVFSCVCALAGVAFFSAGTIGLLRFGDLRSRLHALAKADTLGLGFVVLALFPWSGSIAFGASMVVVWLLALVAAATSAHLLATESPHD